MIVTLTVNAAVYGVEKPGHGRNALIPGIAVIFLVILKKLALTHFLITQRVCLLRLKCTINPNVLAVSTTRCY